MKFQSILFTALATSLLVVAQSATAQVLINYDGPFAKLVATVCDAPTYQPPPKPLTPAELKKISHTSNGEILLAIREMEKREKEEYLHKKECLQLLRESVKKNPYPQWKGIDIPKATPR
jgi:hypothetical protein